MVIITGLLSDSSPGNITFDGDYVYQYDAWNHRQREVRAPNSPIMRYEYDAKGRRVASRTFAVSNGQELELSRTQTVYDADDRAIRTINWERKHNAAEPELNAGNSVRTFVHTWYDNKAGRIVATANFGTGTEHFDSSTDPNFFPPCPVDPPSVAPAGQGDILEHALLTLYAYDSAGRQSEVTHPDGTVTKTEYDGLGRVVLQTENANDSNPDLIRRTAYKYDDKGRLTHIAAVLPDHVSNPATFKYADITWSATDATLQVTEMRYGAHVFDSNQQLISENNGFIAAVLFPDKTTGQPTQSDIFLFDYYSDGSVARRTDAKGNVFTHKYDEQGRRVETTIEDANWYLQPAPGQLDTRPKHRISKITYSYETDGLLGTVIAYERDEAGQDVETARNIFAYDELRNLTREEQIHSSIGGVPAVVYQWDFASASSSSPFSFNRLANIQYPNRPVTGGHRAVDFDHGQSDSADFMIGRIRGIKTQLEPNAGATGYAAQYGYAGTQRRVSLGLGCGVLQSFFDGSAYAGLDRFGRVADLLYKLGSTPLHEYQYGYDRMGNREYAKVTQATFANIPHENDRSWAYQYDKLQRLIDAKMGALSGEPSSPQIASPKSLAWTLDNLGNWDQRLAGEFPEIPSVFHTVDAGNRLTNVTTIPDSPPGSTVAIVNDANGNITDDGDYVYQYDAWNRLVQVNQRGTATFAADGRIDGGDLGDLVARFQYDGVGRLIVKETPVTTGTTALQIKHYYYDGVRRIQEVIDRPPPLPQPRNCCIPGIGCELVEYEEDCDAVDGTLLAEGEGCNLCEWRCCLDDGTCEDRTAENCAKDEGLFGIEGQLCADGECHQACCMDNGSCQDLTFDACLALTGVPQGAQSTCAGITCQPQQHPCCLYGGACQMLTTAACTSQGGTSLPGIANCSEADCPRACCLPDGTCTILTEEACDQQHGRVAHVLTGCATGLCPATEGCCLENADPPSPVACANLVPYRCQELGGWSMGPGSSCPIEGCFDWIPPVEMGMGNDELPVQLYGEFEVPPPQQIVERGEDLPPGDVYADREYVYGPDYVDEFIAQFDREGHAIFMLQDGNYNVVALVAGAELPNGDGQGGILQTGTVLQQYTYEPYGTLIAVESLLPSAQGQPPLFPVNRVGHQGLFFERFDGNYNDQTLEAPTAPAFGGAPGQINQVKGLYYNRNRFYSPRFGRFTSKDPNETALTIISALAMNATGLDVMVGPFSAQGLFGDGMNLYAYLGGNPLNRVDALGLEYDDFDAFEDDYVGGRLYAVGLINESARAASISMEFAGDIASSLLGIDVMHSVIVITNGKGGFWDAMNIFMAVNPIGKAGKIGSKVFRAIGRGFKWRWGAKAVKGALQLTGQIHHAISMRVWKAIQNHPILSKLGYKYRDSRFVSQAIDKAAHNGYQTWHREVDELIETKIRQNPGWTGSEFEAWLKNLFETDPRLTSRFPNGL